MNMTDMEANQQISMMRLKRSLQKKYGKPSKVYERWPPKGSVAAKPEFFVVSIYEKKRMHLCYWNKNLPDNIESISLEIFADVGYESYVKVVYEYKNFDNVAKAIESKNEDAL